MSKYITKIRRDGQLYDIKASSVSSGVAPQGSVLKSDGSGGTVWSQASGVESISSYSGNIELGTGLTIGGGSGSTGGTMQCIGTSYATTAPSSANPSGVRIAIFQEPSGTINYQTGWLYFILEPNG